MLYSKYNPPSGLGLAFDRAAQAYLNKTGYADKAQNDVRNAQKQGYLPLSAVPIQWRQGLDPDTLYTGLPGQHAQTQAPQMMNALAGQSGSPMAYHPSQRPPDPDNLPPVAAPQPTPPPTTQPMPAWTPPPPPQAPANMLGSSYGVSGMMNALSGFGLPRY